MKKSISLGIASLMLLSISCREESLVQTNDVSLNAKISDASVLDGRLRFINKESFQFAYNNIKDEGEEVIADYVDSKGIISLVPIVTEKNEKKVAEQLKIRVNELKSNKRLMNSNSKIVGALSSYSRVEGVNMNDVEESIEDIEDIILDDAYAALLNDNAEIHVGDKIYKYTDVGMFAVKDSEYEELKSYLADRNISDNLLYSTEKEDREKFLNSTPSGSMVYLADNIEYFREDNLTLLLPDDGSGSGEAGGGSGYTPPPASATKPLYEVIENLPIGVTKKPLVANLFGVAYVTHDKYSDKRRVKIKYYSQNYGLAYVVGCKVKHQFKGWTGTWRKENVTKLGMGAHIEWTFEHKFNSALANAAIDPRKPIYYFEGKAYTDVNDYVAALEGRPASKPKLPFEKQVDGVIEFLVGADTLTPAQRKQIMDELVKNGLSTLEKRFNKKYNHIGIVIAAKQEVYISYYDYETLRDNQDVIEKIFDWGVATPKISYTFGGGVGNGFSINMGQFDFSRPKAKRIRMYGIALSGNVWRGNKLIVE